MSKIYKIFISLLMLIVFSLSFSSCKEDDDVCFTCVKTSKAQSDPDTGPTTTQFCDTEEKAYNTKLDYEAQGYVCSEK